MMYFALSHGMRFGSTAQPSVNFLRIFMTDGCVLQFCREGMGAGIYSDAGHNTCGSNYNKDPHGLGAGLWQHEIQDAERYFNDWGFDFIKIDWCGGSKVGSSWRVSGDIRPNWPSICDMINKNLYLSAYTGGGHYNDMDMMVVGYNGGKDSAFREDSYGSNFGLTYIHRHHHQP